MFIPASRTYDIRAKIIKELSPFKYPVNRDELKSIGILSSMEM